MQSERSGPGVLLSLAAVVIVFAGLRTAGPIMVPMLFAGLVAFVTYPLVRTLEALRVPRALAVTLAILIDLAVLVGLGALVGRSIDEVSGALPRYAARVVELAEELVAWARDQGATVPDDALMQLIAPARVAQLAGVVFQTASDVVSNLLVVVLMALFMLLEAAGLRDKLAIAVPGSHDTLVRVQRAGADVQRYLLVKTGVSVLNGALLSLAAALCGVDFPIAWGLLLFVLNYIPTVGAAVAVVPPIVLALVQHGPGRAAVFAAAALSANFIVGNLLEPRIVGRAVGLSPLVVFLSVLFWGFLWGPVGALLAVPLTMAVKLGLDQVDSLKWLSILLGPSPAPAKLDQTATSAART